ncbi:MAG: Fic family protein [Patescibacteria group bacterium]
MVEFSYSVSPILKKSLEIVEGLRRNILLIPLSPKTELRYRWEATINRIYWSLTLSENNLGKKEIIKIVTTQPKKKLSPEGRDVINYRNALRYIHQYWLVTPRMVTVKSLQTLHNLACSGNFRIPEATVKQMLDYLQAAPEHPVVQAAAAQIQCMGIAPFTDGNGRTSRLLSYLFLCKQGYDTRGLLVMEEYWRHNLATFRGHTQEALKTGNLTLWIEYFTQACIYQLEKAKQDLTSQRFAFESSPSFYHLNDRQQEILFLLEQPEASITNKKVQGLFKISQITASRDLAKLVSLDLLFPHGRGRSVYYTKV